MSKILRNFGSRTTTTTTTTTTRCDCLPSWPTSFSPALDSQSPLPSIKPYSKHLLVFTPKRGAHDWHYNASAPNSISSSLLALLKSPPVDTSTATSKTSNLVSTLTNEKSRILVNQITSKVKVENPSDTREETTCLLFPDGIRIDGVSPSNVHQLYNDFLNPSPSHSVPSDLLKRSHTTFTLHQIKNPTILICGHQNRDARCGLVAPILHAHITHFLSLHDKAANVYYVSHVGGHKFAGNLVVYDPDGGGIWYSRVNLENIDDVLYDSLFPDDGKGNGRRERVDGLVRYATGRFLQN